MKRPDDYHQRQLPLLWCFTLRHFIDILCYFSFRVRALEVISQNYNISKTDYPIDHLLVFKISKFSLNPVYVNINQMILFVIIYSDFIIRTQILLWSTSLTRSSSYILLSMILIVFISPLFSGLLLMCLFYGSYHNTTIFGPWFCESSRLYNDINICLCDLA